MDAASNNSVDDIRDLRERVGYAPVAGGYKVYILDEAHMLTPAAWNAFLKTLEEPPPHTIFVLATTEANKVLPTVVDRCHRFDFGRPSVVQIASVLRRVADSESIEIPDEAVALVARSATGSFRDALGTLEQLLAYSGSAAIVLEDVLAVLGAADADLLFGTLDAVAGGDARGALLAAARLADSGRDIGRFFGDLEAHARGLLVTQVLGEVPAELRVTPEQDERLAEQARRVGGAEIVRLLELIAFALRAMKDGADPRTQLELALVKAAKPDLEPSVKALQERIARLESRAAAPAAAAAARTPERAETPAGRAATPRRRPAPRRAVTAAGRRAVAGAAACGAGARCAAPRPRRLAPRRLRRRRPVAAAPPRRRPRLRAAHAAEPSHAAAPASPPAAPPGLRTAPSSPPADAVARRRHCVRARPRPTPPRRPGPAPRPHRRSRSPRRSRDSRRSRSPRRCPARATAAPSEAQEAADDAAAAVARELATEADPAPASPRSRPSTRTPRRRPRRAWSSRSTRSATSWPAVIESLRATHADARRAARGLRARLADRRRADARLAGVVGVPQAQGRGPREPRPDREGDPLGHGLLAAARLRAARGGRPGAGRRRGRRRRAPKLSDDDLVQRFKDEFDAEELPPEPEEQT